MKKLVFWIILSAVVMLGLPGLTVAFIQSNAAMAICFLLFFAIDPLYSFMLGVFAGKKPGELWSLPVISAGLFLLGTWIFFDMGEPAFVLYAGVYLVLGFVAMLVSLVMDKRKKKTAEPEKAPEEIQEIEIPEMHDYEK